MTIIAEVLAGLAAVSVMVSILLIQTQNRLVALDQRCQTAFADIDAHLKHRHNLIPGLAETVRGFASHESGILLGITQARADALKAVTPEMRLEAENNITQNISALVGMAEKYPELKASSHFNELRRELVDAENRITAARRFYNLAVGEYDSSLRQFPGSVVARFNRLDRRMPFDLGIERVLLDEPVALKF